MPFSSRMPSRNQEHLQARDGIALGIALALDIGAIKLFVVRQRMRIRTNHMPMHKCRTLARADSARPPLHRGIAGHRIGAINFFKMKIGEILKPAAKYFRPAVFTSTGTEIAYSLSSTQKSTGSLLGSPPRSAPPRIRLRWWCHRRARHR